MPELAESGAEAPSPIGIARLVKLAFDGADLRPLWCGLVERVQARPDAAALMDIATIEQIYGNEEAGRACQREALALRRVYRSPCAAAKPRVRLLALAAPGDMGANTPLEFLIEGSDVALTTFYVVPGAAPARLPDFDVAMVTVGESDANRAALAEIARLTANWHRPPINPPHRIAQLSRAGVASLFAEAPGLLAPPTRRIERDALAQWGSDPQLFPLIARPLDSHAGRGLARLADTAALERYLAARPEAEFHVAPYIDYRSADGWFRKYRIAFVGGEPFACHMAIADQWMIYYLNAGMREAAWKRDEEARFMAEFDRDFAPRHKAALAAIAERIGLEYFAIDCAELPDGRLLLFEADVAMIVHAMDPPDTFPYKPAQMRKIFAAFRALLIDRAAAAQAA